MKLYLILTLTTPQVREFVRGNYASYIFVQKDYPVSVGQVVKLGLNDSRDSELLKDSNLLNKEFKVSEITPFDALKGVKVVENKCIEVLDNKKIVEK